MKRGCQPHGYTLIEVMVFLAVTAALFASAVLLIQGQQSKTQFSQAMRDLDSQIRDTINGVGTGYYPQLNNFECYISGNSPAFRSNPASTVGTKTPCTFIGKVVQFGVRTTGCTGGVTDNCTNFNVYTMVGLREKANSTPITTLKEAAPTVLFRTSVIDATDRLVTQYGLHVTRVYSVYNGTPNYGGSVGFFTTFGSLNSVGDLLSGANSTDMVVIPNSSLGQTDNSTSTGAIATINNMKSQSTAQITNRTNPTGGVTICLSGPYGRKGAITIGSDNHKLTTEVTNLPPAGVCP